MPTVDDHFSGRSAQVFREDPKKTSIHLNRLVHKTEQASANRWQFEVPLNDPAEVDEQILQWLHASYELAQ